MSQQTRQKVLLAALLVTIVWGVYHLGPWSAGEPAPAPSRPKPALFQADTIAHAARDTAVMSALQSAAWGADPFRARKAVERKPVRRPPIWRVSGIMFNNETPLAIINDRPVRVGETVNNARVVDIQPKAVTLEYQGKQFKLTVNRG
jgi:type II secretory pathway component PulC